MSTQFSNQLKLNSNTVVDGLNLVNVVRKPQPIIIENVNHRNFSPPTRDVVFNKRSDFEVIDVNKMTMYSYLVKRELKTKDWLSKFHLNNAQTNNAPNTQNVSSSKKTPEKKKSVVFLAENNLDKKSVNTLSPTRVVNRVFSKPNNELNELQNCCSESIKAIEYLEQKLNEFKFERLKIVLNDPIEEEKQKRIQLEQIKYLSRSMYNCQMNLSKFSSQLKQINPVTSTNSSKSTSTISPLARLVHTMRQVNKSIYAFADFYPYRPDNHVQSEKLCFHFYKQVHSCVESFNQCILNALTSSNGVAQRLTTLLISCDQYFGEFRQIEQDDVDSKALVKYVPPHSESSITHTKKSNDGGSKIFNIVRVPRTNRPISSGPKSVKSGSSVVSTTSEATSVVVPTKTILEGAGKTKQNWDSVSNARIELSPSRKSKKDVFQKKKIKTANLYPNNNKSKQQVQKSKIQIKPSKKAAVQELSILVPKGKLGSLDDLNSTIDSISSQQIYKPAFEHLSSPVLSKLGYNNRHRSAETTPTRQRRQRHYSNEPYDDEERDQTPMNQSLNSSINYSPSYSPSRSNMRRIMPPAQSGFENGPKFLGNESIQDYSENYSNGFSKPILKNNIKKPTWKSRNALNRLELIKNENEMIKRKYENLAYEQHLIEKFSDNSRTRRPYEECYAKTSTEKEENEAKFDFNQIYKPLRHPTLDQLKRVVNYSERFADYNDKTSITRIGGSQFDDFELFELLSKEIFKECFDEVCAEVETINSEITSNLVNGEFVTVGDDLGKKMRNFSSSLRSSPTRTSVISRRNGTNLSPVNSYYDESFVSTQS